MQTDGDYFMGNTPPLAPPSPDGLSTASAAAASNGVLLSQYVIETLALVETDYAYFIVMPYYQCELLACRMDSTYGLWDENRWAEQVVVRFWHPESRWCTRDDCRVKHIFAMVSIAVHSLHAHNIVHGDISAENVFVNVRKEDVNHPLNGLRGCPWHCKKFTRQCNWTILMIGVPFVLGALGDFGMAKLVQSGTQLFTTGQVNSPQAGSGTWTQTSYKDYYRPIELHLINSHMQAFLGPEFRTAAPSPNASSGGEGVGIIHPNILSCDVYALGMLLFILITREAPFRTPTSELFHWCFETLL
jgi:serine/threonine protein kinase